MTRFLHTLLLLPIAFYRRVLSPLKGAPSCRFLPTCSEYAAEAVRTRGAFVGIVLATWRVLRCHPFARAGYDPVPPRRTEHSAHCAHCAEDHV